MNKPDHVDVLGTDITTVSMDSAAAIICEWAKLRAPRNIGLCNTHSLVTAKRDPLFYQALKSFDMNTPDGAPVGWLASLLIGQKVSRLCGPDLMLRLLEIAEHRGLKIGLLGSSPETLGSLVKNITERHPLIKIVYKESPPFRKPTEAEDEERIELINSSGVEILFVSLGCPKQELWMAKHAGKINCPSLGVGAAFDFHAGTIKRAPLWMRNFGLEWLHRLASEPRRLWKRYLINNALFTAYALRQVIFREPQHKKDLA